MADSAMKEEILSVGVKVSPHDKPLLGYNDLFKLQITIQRYQPFFFLCLLKHCFSILF